MRYGIALILILCIVGVSRAQEGVSAEIVRKADSAITVLRAALSHNPKDGPSLIAMANVYYDLEKWDTAITFYRAYISENPRDTNARVDYAWALYANDTSAIEESKHEIATALEQNPRMFNALYDYGLLILKGAETRNHMTEAERSEATRYLTSALKEARLSHPESVQQLESTLYELEHPQ